MSKYKVRVTSPLGRTEYAYVEAVYYCIGRDGSLVFYVRQPVGYPKFKASTAYAAKEWLHVEEV